MYNVHDITKLVINKSKKCYLVFICVLSLLIKILFQEKKSRILIKKNSQTPIDRTGLRAPNRYFPVLIIRKFCAPESRGLSPGTVGVTCPFVHDVSKTVLPGADNE